MRKDEESEGREWGRMKRVKGGNEEGRREWREEMRKDEESEGRKWGSMKRVKGGNEEGWRGWRGGLRKNQEMDWRVEGNSCGGRVLLIEVNKRSRTHTLAEEPLLGTIHACFAGATRTKCDWKLREGAAGASVAILSRDSSRAGCFLFAVAVAPTLSGTSWRRRHRCWRTGAGKRSHWTACPATTKVSHFPADAEFLPSPVKIVSYFHSSQTNRDAEFLAVDISPHFRWSLSWQKTPDRIIWIGRGGSVQSSPAWIVIVLL